MSSMTLLLIFAVGIISIWSEPIRVEFLERRNEEVQGLVQCLADAFVTVSADMEDAPLMSEEEMVEKEACLFFQEMKTCLVKKIRQYQPPEKPPRMLLLSAAIECQNLKMAHRAGLCTHLPFKELCEAASDTLAELEPLEGKQYKDCLKNVMQRCLSKMMNDFKEQKNVQNPHFEYIECYENKSDNIDCKPEMLNVFLSNMADVKNVWKVAKQGNY